MQHLDFAKIAKAVGIEAIEYVNQFFMDKATDAAYLAEMNTRAKGEGVTQVLIMCDSEGRLGDPDAAKRQTAVENHYKWVDGGQDARLPFDSRQRLQRRHARGADEARGRRPAQALRVCRHAWAQRDHREPRRHEQQRQVADGEIKQADHPRAGTLPDFGNFSISRPTQAKPDAKVESYDSYVGVKEMMPLAKGVSVKPRVMDFHGNSGQIDLPKMMKIVVDAGYHGYCGIEHGESGRELDSIRALREQLEAARSNSRSRKR